MTIGVTTVSEKIEIRARPPDHIERRKVPSHSLASVVRLSIECFGFAQAFADYLADPRLVCIGRQAFASARHNAGSCHDENGKLADDYGQREDQQQNDGGYRADDKDQGCQQPVADAPLDLGWRAG